MTTHSILIKSLASAALAAALVTGAATTASAGPRSTDGQPCADWTNDDGTHGTNCPTGGGGSGARLRWERLTVPFT